jgi:hypothetical protein
VSATNQRYKGIFGPRQIALRYRLVDPKAVFQNLAEEDLRHVRETQANHIPAK